MRAAPCSPPALPSNFVTLVDVQHELVEWLWQGWIPLGVLTVLDGDPGLGKSTLLLDLAARLSRGGPMPDGSACAVGATVILSAEDQLSTTVQPRLVAAGADLTRIHSLDSQKALLPQIPHHLGVLEAMCQRTDARLLILDPWTAFLSTAVDNNHEQHVRQTLHRLAQLAWDRRCAVVLLRHLNKQGGRQVLYRGGGSIGIIAAARSGLVVAADPQRPEQRVLAVAKTNLGPMPKGQGFRLQETPNGRVSCLPWMGCRSRSRRGKKKRFHLIDRPGRAQSIGWEASP